MAYCGFTLIPIGFREKWLCQPIKWRRNDGYRLTLMVPGRAPEYLELRRISCWDWASWRWHGGLVESRSVGLGFSSRSLSPAAFMLVQNAITKSPDPGLSRGQLSDPSVSLRARQLPVVLGNHRIDVVDHVRNSEAGMGEPAQ
jgi:hypothetical protein